MIITKRIKNILLYPKPEWELITSEENTLGSILLKYVIPLSLIPSLAGFTGFSLIGKTIPVIGNYHSFSWGLSVAFSTLFGTLIVIPLSVVIIDSLASSFESEKNLNKTAQLVAYSFTPYWLAGIINLIPALSIFSILAGFYGLYILYLGLGPMKNTPEEKKISFCALILLVIVVISGLTAVILLWTLRLFGFESPSCFPSI